MAQLFAIFTFTSYLQESGLLVFLADIFFYSIADVLVGD
jgi:hypothetical protein